MDGRADGRCWASCWTAVCYCISFFCFQRHCVFTFKVTQHQSANVLVTAPPTAQRNKNQTFFSMYTGRACTITRFNRNRRPDLNTGPTTPTTNHRVCYQSLYFFLTLTAKLSNQIACTWLETAEAQQTTAGSGRLTQAGWRRSQFECVLL